MAKKKVENEEIAEVKNLVTIEDAGICKKKITVEVPQESIKKMLEEQYKELKDEALVPGFRKGRVPARLLEKKFGKEVAEQVKLKLLAQASDAAIKDNNIESLGEPDVDFEKVEMPSSGPMKFSFEVEVRPEFELPALEGIEINKPKFEVTDSQVDEELKGLQKRAGIWTPQEGGKAEVGDQVIADIEVKAEDEAEPTRSDNDEVLIRKNGFVGGVAVPELDELLTGAKQGDVKTATVDVPATFYNEKYRGKKVEVKISIKDVKRQVPAELNADFFAKFGIADEAELKQRLREMLSDRHEQQARDAMTEQVYKYLGDNVSFELPAAIVADQSSRILQREYVNLMMRGVPKEELEGHLQELRAGSEARAKEQLKVFFIMDKISSKLGVEVSEDEINGHIARIAAQRNKRPEKMRDEMVRDGSLAQFSLQVREEKCVSKLLETAKINDVEPAAMEEKKKTAKKAKKEESSTEEPAKKAKKKKSEE